MTSYGRTPPRVYVVAWADAQIVKVGVTTRERYRGFLRSGGELIGFQEFATGEMAWHAERALIDCMDAVWPPAFDSFAQAVPFLGGNGGWCECYNAPVEAARSLFELMRRACWEAAAELACPLPTAQRAQPA